MGRERYFDLHTCLEQVFFQMFSAMCSFGQFSLELFGDFAKYRPCPFSQSRKQVENLSVVTVPARLHLHALYSLPPNHDMPSCYSSVRAITLRAINCIAQHCSMCSWWHSAYNVAGTGWHVVSALHSMLETSITQRWIAGQQFEGSILQQGVWFITNLISSTQVVSGPV